MGIVQHHREVEKERLNKKKAMDQKGVEKEVTKHNSVGKYLNLLNRNSPFQKREKK